MKKKNAVKKVMAALLAVIITLSIFPLSVIAAPSFTSGTLQIGFYVFETAPPSSPLLGTDLRLPPKTFISGGTHYAAYCLEHAKGSTDGSVMSIWEGLEPAKKNLYTDIMGVGFQWKSSSNWGEGAPQAHQWAVTQMLIWAAELGIVYKSDEGVIVIPTSVDTEINKVAPHSYYPDQMKAYYQTLKAELIKLYQIPSFAAPQHDDIPTAIKLKWDGTQYSTTVTDTNGVLDRYDFRLDGFNITRSGDKMTVSATAETAANGEQVSNKAEFFPQIHEDNFMAFKSGASSDQAVGVYDGAKDGDPVAAYVKFSFDAVGDAGIIKTSEDGDIAGKTFQIIGSDSSDTTVTTDSSGAVTTDMLPLYVVTTDPESGEESQGERITYTVQETNVPSKYVIPEPQTFQLFEGQTTSIEFENRLKKWRVAVKKRDREKEYAQGDASLFGAEYGLYYQGKLLDTYTTDANGEFTTKWYICGSVPSAILKEITPSEGYLLDPTEYTVGVAPGSTTVEYNSTTKTVTEQVKKNQIQIVKYKEFVEDERDEEEKNAEEGAEFQVWLDSAGSYEKARADEREILTTDENGYALTKSLPYGRYRIHQTKGADGFEFINDIVVFIGEDSSIKTIPYHFTLRNKGYESEVLIVKKDSETGKTVPATGIYFKVKDLATDEFITQYVRYPSGVFVSEFATDVSGRLLLPEVLTYGEYELYEVSGPYGYVLNTDPVKFTVDGTQKVVTVEKENVPQKGTISILKTGEIFSSVINSNGKYIPVYEETVLQGAEFRIYADADVRTEDGTLRYKKDQLIDTKVTDNKGGAKSIELYLGLYRIDETKAPNGMVLNKNPLHIELKYAGQEITVTNLELLISNDRQKPNIKLLKTLETDGDTGLGLGDEYKNVLFGIYAAEKITAADGKSIPVDGLIETFGINADGKGITTADVPQSKYYAKEIATDEHYFLTDKKYPFEFKHGSSELATIDIAINGGEAIQNKIKRGGISTTKVNAEDPEDKLPGAVFGIYMDVDLDGSYNAEVDEFIVNLEETALGFYEYSGLPAGEFFLHEDKAPASFAADANYYPFSINDDSQTVVFETIPGKDFPNKKIRGIVHTTKVNASDPTDKLSGAEFAVYQDMNGDKAYDADDNEVGKLKEVSLGFYELTDLPEGYFFINELKAPAGFARDVNYYPFEITEDGQIIRFETIPGRDFPNKEKAEGTPQTGNQDGAMIPFIIGGICLAVAGLIVLIALLIKKWGKQPQKEE